MTISQAVLVYTLKQGGGASVADLAIAMAMPPVPQSVLAAIGARLTSDVTSTAGTTVTRTITLALAAGTPGAATAKLNADNVIEGVPIGTVGLGYNGVPIVTSRGGNPIIPAKFQTVLNLAGATIVQPGTTYTAPTIYWQGGLQIPTTNESPALEQQCCIQALGLIEGGSGYSSNATVEFTCEIAPGGSKPTASLTFDRDHERGEITGLLLTSTGNGLITIPEVFVNDPGPASTGAGGGTGAVLAPMLGVGTAATMTLSLTGGAVTGVAVTAAGGPYVQMPVPLILDTTGSGAELTPLMGLKSILPTFGGQGYQSVPTIEIQDLFVNLFGGHAGPSTQGPFWNLMKIAIEQAVGSPIVATAPAVS